MISAETESSPKVQFRPKHKPEYRSTTEIFLRRYASKLIINQIIGQPWSSSTGVSNATCRAKIEEEILVLKGQSLEKRYVEFSRPVSFQLFLTAIKTPTTAHCAVGEKKYGPD